MKFCSKCGTSMVDAAMYDPEGVIPLATEVDIDDCMWACLLCSAKAAEEIKKDI